MFKSYINMSSILKLEDLLKQPGWDTRKRILEELKMGSKNAYELSKTLDLNYSSVKYHIELLQKFGLIKAEKKGRRFYYALTKNGTILLLENVKSDSP